jgi:murein DD-endopeptidase MepM/ murein hydrolase activator NlpD
LYAKHGFARHNGIDLFAPVGRIVYAPLDAEVTRIAFEEGGSGLYLCMLSQEEYRFDDGVRARVEATFMHLQRTLREIGAEVHEGDELAVSGRTGMVTGPHLHMGLKRVYGVSGDYFDIDSNDAMNTFDPDSYWSGRYACDASTEHGKG